MNRAAQEFALLAFLREWFTQRTEWPAEYAKSHPEACAELAPQTTAVEALLWLRWGVELGFFPSDSLAIVAESQRAEFGQALSAVANEPKYKLPVSVTGLSRDALVAQEGYTQPASLHPHFQHLAMLAAAYAKQDPATTMLATITVEQTPGNTSFYELPKVVGTLSGVDVGAALTPWGTDGKPKSGPEPALAGAFGIAGVLQTLDYFAAVESFFATLSQLTALEAPPPAPVDGRLAERAPGPLNAEDVARFGRRFMACQGWRINLGDTEIARRFTTLIGFATNLILEELMADWDRVMERVAKDRKEGASLAAGPGAEAELELQTTQFNPVETVSEWHREATQRVADWQARLRGEQHFADVLQASPAGTQVRDGEQLSNRLRGMEE